MTVISNSAFERITILAYKKMIGLLIDFYTSKESGEVLKAIK